LDSLSRLSRENAERQTSTKQTDKQKDTLYVESDDDRVELFRLTEIFDDVSTAS